MCFEYSESYVVPLQVPMKELIQLLFLAQACYEWHTCVHILLSLDLAPALENTFTFS